MIVLKNLENSLKLSNIEDISNQLENFIRSEVKENFRKNGVVIGLSGGLDSSVTAALSVKSLGPENVLGLILPEKESSPKSENLAKSLANELGIKTETIDMTSILDAFNIYDIRENVVKKYFNSFTKGCTYRLVVSRDAVIKGGLRIPFLEIQDNKKLIHKFRLTPSDFSTLSSATSIKHRSRMSMLYFFAEQNNLAVLGSTNKSEYVQGYFVKYGDGGVDLEPIQNLYKTQVFQLAHHLKIPVDIINRKASPDTWSLEVTDEDFFYGINYETLDIILHAKENDVPLANITKLVNMSKLINLDQLQVKNLISYLEKRWNSTLHMRKTPSSLNFKINQ
jgi:NAD+ synthase